MSKKFLITILIVLIIALGYFIFQSISGNSFFGTGENLGVEENARVISAYLEKFPADTEMKPGIKGEKTNKFKNGELMGLNGEIFVFEKTNLELRFVDSKGSEMEAGDRELGMEIKESGGFGMCCLPFPNQPGKYALKLFLDDKETKTISFEVIE